MKKSVKELLALSGTAGVTKQDCEWLLCSLFSCNKSELYWKNFFADEKQLRKFSRWVKKRSQGFPLQYITGVAPFYGRDFLVNNSVLIPRPETEVLLEILVREGDSVGEKLKVLDVGTGSGAIAVSAKLERPHWQVHGSDVSKKALSIAKKNALIHGVRLKWYHSDLLKKIHKNYYDIIVSNPPYLNKKKDFVADDVKKFEPGIALFPMQKDKTKIKDSGAWLADKLISQAITGSRPPKKILLELSPRVARRLEKKWSRNVVIKNISRKSDLSGRMRFLLIAL